MDEPKYTPSEEVDPDDRDPSDSLRATLTYEVVTPLDVDVKEPKDD